jgi:protein DEK
LQATFADTVKLLGKRFNVDLTPRKASIKTIIQEELTKLVAEDDEKAARGEEVEDRLKNLHP